eukprot:CAMPEP_0116144110 /NCGR_PEP_ID=MMETSP0329-20121206/15815_1 /TAXON_ID=697910 /ORGANISM="Pseudo-nitzschia arenysensis, Strain B593" /LENGTH=601 /DNA_ID=CAMNT_0003639487 /DNA_START=129 /DNA_END=1934 /DNA_ORIENTATION=+
MASGSMFSLRALPLLLILSLLNFSEVSARVGSKQHAESANNSHRDIRKLAGQYNRPHPPANHNGHYYPRHHGQYDYYYIKRPVDPSEYYHNYRPAAEPTSTTRRPTAPPTKAPQPGIPVATVPKPTLQPTLPPTKPPTEAPVPEPSLTPSDPPVELTDSPTEMPVPPPTFNPAIVVDLEVVGGDDENVIVKPEIGVDGPGVVIDFEEPSPIQLRIAEFALGGGSEFKDRSSYQWLALQRVEEQVGAEDMSDVKLLQYYVLYCIFEATNAKSNEFIKQSRAFGDDESDIPGWTIKTGWLEKNLDPCLGGWYGILCDEDQIVNVDLFDNGLTGNFAPEIKLLAGDGFYSTGAGNLVSLDIFNNQLMSNNGDNSWIADLGSGLGYLYLQNTGFMGKLPPKFPEGLVELDIANSLITGGLPGDAFSGLSSLRFLLMDGVQLDSSIPTEIATLPNLEYLFATDSMLTGDLSYMENMPVIFEHWVDRNPNMGGQIPNFLGSLTTLQSFSIAECGFTGTIPESLGNLGLMQQMWLYGNQLTGEIPASLGNLGFMRIFEVEGNNLSDGMPQSVCDNFASGMLQVLGADCDSVDCPCCTCCSVEECQVQN